MLIPKHFFWDGDKSWFVDKRNGKPQASMDSACRVSMNKNLRMNKHLKIMINLHTISNMKMLLYNLNRQLVNDSCHSYSSFHSHSPSHCFLKNFSQLCIQIHFSIVSYLQTIDLKLFGQRLWLLFTGLSFTGVEHYTE